MSTIVLLHRQAVRVLLAASAAAALVGPAAYADGEPRELPDPCELEEPCSDLDFPLLHPLMDAAIPDGRVPVLDIKDTQNGQRFAVEDAQRVEQEGQMDERSEVVALEQRRPNPGERAEMENERLEANGGLLPAYDDEPSDKIGRGLRDAMQQAGSGAPIDVSLRLADRRESATVMDEIERAIGRGELRTRSDLRLRRSEILSARAERLAWSQQRVADRIAQLGGETTRRFRNLPGLEARLTPAQIETLAGYRVVERLDLSATGQDDIDGNHMIRGAQIAQFLNSGWDGENGSDTDIPFAVIESTEVHDDHVGFVDSSSASSSPRIRVRYECDSSGCSSTPNFTSPGSHSTAVNSIVFGDLRDGQDAAVTDTLERKQKSGYAGEARGYVYATGFNTSEKREALDHVIGRTHTPHVVNMSWSDYGDDTQCEGDTSFSKDANDLFEAGLLLVKSAGNTPGSSTNCTIGAPGAAIGVFTVGGHGNSTTSTDYLDVETASIYSNSGMGGVSSSEGINRSIVDVTAYACREDLFDTSGGYSQAGCGTSYSTPTVTAAAIDHVDFYKNNKSDLVDNPGILFSHLLLMGDREGQSGSMTSRFDSLWGAGRLKMRKLGSEGMDAPYGWATGYTCVDDGQTVTLSVNGGAALSPDVDYLKAVVYWFDPRHEKGKSVSDLDLRLKTTGGTTLRSSLDYYDNKERVFYRGVGGQAVKLEINGWDVKTDTTSCGSNSMKVYYAWYYEDGDRDDADGPGSLVDPE